MSEAMLISQIALWVLLLVMAGLQFALLRQIGVLHERIAELILEQRFTLGPAAHPNGQR